MSWDIWIQRFNRVYLSDEEIPDEEICLALGTRSEVQTAISSAFCGTDWSDPCWGVYESPAGSIEFNLGAAEPNDGFMLHVRASEEIVAPIAALCRANSWQALDISTGAFLEQSADPAAGLHSWTAYRNQTLDQA